MRARTRGFAYGARCRGLCGLLRALPECFSRTGFLGKSRGNSRERSTEFPVGFRTGRTGHPLGKLRLPRPEAGASTVILGYVIT